LSRRLLGQCLAIADCCARPDDVKPLDVMEADGSIDNRDCPKRRAVGHDHRSLAGCSETVALPDLNRGLSGVFREERDSHDRTTRENRAA
jgi:hypothetical protein